MSDLASSTLLRIDTRRWAFGLVACLLLFAPQTVRAHAESLSGMQVMLRDDGTRVSISLPLRELSRWFEPAKFPNYATSVTVELEKADLVQVQYGEASSPSPTAIHAHLEGDASIVIDSDFPPMARDEGTLAVWSTAIGNLPNDHKQFLTIEDHRAGVDRVVAQETLTVVQDAWSGTLPNLPIESNTTSTSQPTRKISPAERAAKIASDRPSGTGHVTSFFLLGIEHILTGYDHLLFLGALLLICSKFRDAAKIVTVFTVAHSITLALAAFDIVRIPSRVVEPVIAASIVYVAFENMVVGEKAQRWRYVIVFGFGLIHGLGFASALREVGLGSSGSAVALPLIKFNLGVETGQLAVAAAVLPLVFWLKKRPLFVTRGVPIASAAIASLGAFWFIERLLDSGS